MRLRRCRIKIARTRSYRGRDTPQGALWAKFNNENTAPGSEKIGIDEMASAAYLSQFI
jgi:hypothetical protein